MKRNVLFISSFVILTVLAVSCDLKTVMSPGVQFSSVLYRTSSVTDSTGQVVLVNDTITLSDSLNVGDTVRLPMILNGYYDYITSFAVSTDTSKVHLSLMWGDEYNSYLTTAADPEHGILAFKPDAVYAFLTTLVYVPQVSGTYRIDMELNSAAQAPYSQWTGHFFIGVK